LRCLTKRWAATRANEKRGKKPRVGNTQTRLKKRGKGSGGGKHEALALVVSIIPGNGSRMA